MKKFFIAAAFLMAAVASNANNTNKQVSYRVAEAFCKQYTGIKEVKWSSAANNLLRASFIQDEEHIHAFFNEEGEYIASTVVIDNNEIPKKLAVAISSKFDNAVVIEALELRGTDEHAFFIKILQAGKEKLVKGDRFGLVQELSLKNAF